jgi:sugar phosphate isomerase/epimerase
VLLSTSSVFPEPTSAAFEIAATLGYDGLEVMVWTDPVSQDLAALQGLSEHYGVKVGSVHAPCLLVTQRVWSSDPTVRLRRSAELAHDLGAATVVVHPPFTWQREYARGFAATLTRLRDDFPDIDFAREHVPGTGTRAEFVPLPGWDPTRVGPDAYTLDLSHCARSRPRRSRRDGPVGPCHLGDSTGEGRDEHLGRAAKPASSCSPAARTKFHLARPVEVNTRRAKARDVRRADLAETLAFARAYLKESTVDV